MKADNDSPVLRFENLRIPVKEYNDEHDELGRFAPGGGGGSGGSDSPAAGSSGGGSDQEAPGLGKIRIHADGQTFTAGGATITAGKTKIEKSAPSRGGSGVTKFAGTPPKSGIAVGQKYGITSTGNYSPDLSGKWVVIKTGSGRLDAIDVTSVGVKISDS